MAKKTTGYEIMAMRRSVEQQQAYQRSDCPTCGWPLDVSFDGILHCIFDGWTDQQYITRRFERYNG